MRDRLGVFLASTYLLAVAFWLVATRQIVASALPKLLLRPIRPRYKADLSDFRQETGACWLVATPDFLLTDKESISSLKLLENGKPLGPGHCSHDEIRGLGGGRYSHWGGRLYFSTSDNSDPTKNGRRYRVAEG